MFAPKVAAQETAHYSASLNNSVNTRNNDLNNNTILLKKKQTIIDILKKYDSPMLGSADSFILACSKYDIDCYLLPAISGLESTFGNYIYSQSYNPFGWCGGYCMFKNWDEAIFTVAGGLRNNYIDKGAVTLDQIGQIYSESPTWTVRVNYFINEFKKREQEKQLYFEKS